MSRMCYHILWAVMIFIIAAVMDIPAAGGTFLGDKQAEAVKKGQAYARYAQAVGKGRVSSAERARRIEVYVQWACMIADNDIHGYSQGAKNATPLRPYTGSRDGPDFDCSSLVYYALAHAGFPIIEAWHENPEYYALYRGRQAVGDADTIWPDLQKIGGFTRYRWEAVEDDLRRGDILCYPEDHVAIYIGNGRTVEARGVNNPRGGEWRTGDQGGEIDYYDAYGRYWTEVYRYTGN